MSRHQGGPPPPPPQPSTASVHTLRSGGWQIKVHVVSVEWVGEADESAPSLSIQEAAGMLRKLTSLRMQTRTLELDIARGEWPELDAFEDSSGAWRIPISGFQRYLQIFNATLPPTFFLNMVEWGGTAPYGGVGWYCTFIETPPAAGARRQPSPTRCPPKGVGRLGSGLAAWATSPGTRATQVVATSRCRPSELTVDPTPGRSSLLGAPRGFDFGDSDGTRWPGDRVTNRKSILGETRARVPAGPSGYGTHERGPQQPACVGPGPGPEC